MLNDTTPNGYEINNGSAASDGEKSYLASADLSSIARHTTPAEIAAALSVAPGTVDENRSTPARARSLKNSRAGLGVPGPGVNGARRRLRPLALVPRRSKKTSPLKAPTVPLMGVRVDCVTERQVTTHVISSFRAGIGGWIATPNVDHLRIISERPDLLRMVNEASLRVADGMPLVWASRLHGTPLPERITGAGLAVSLTAAAARAGASIFLLGGDPGDAEAAKERMAILNLLPLLDISEAVLRARCRVEGFSGHRYRWSGSRPFAEILANREGANRDGAPGVRLDEMSAGVEHDIPIRTLLRVLCDVVGQPDDAVRLNAAQVGPRQRIADEGSIFVSQPGAAIASGGEIAEGLEGDAFED